LVTVSGSLSGVGTAHARSSIVTGLVFHLLARLVSAGDVSSFPFVLMESPDLAQQWSKLRDLLLRPTQELHTEISFDARKIGEHKQYSVRVAGGFW